jgi:hypothetical protein
MGAARYVGRVGGLAVALGVGTAIATGHGVASAETDAPSPPATNSSNTDQSTTDTTAQSTTDTTAQSTTNTTAQSTTDTTAQSTTNTTPVDPTTTPKTTDSDTSTKPKTSTTVAEGVVSAQTNTGSLSTTKTAETRDEAELPDDEEPTSRPTETADSEPTQTEEPTEEPEAPTEEPEVPTGDLEVPEEEQQAPEEEQQAPEEEPTPVDTSKANTNNTASSTAADPNSTTSASTVQSLPDPASTTQEADNLAVFADARALAAAGPVNVSPMMAAQAAQTTTTAPAPAAAPNLLRAAVNVVSSVVNWVLNPLAGAAPSTPAQPPLIWGLLAFARREFENFFNALAGRPTQQSVQLAAQTTTSLALPPNTERPRFPGIGQQLSPSTNFVDWVTGNYPLNNTQHWYGVTGTDIGVMWDNGMVDDPTTPQNEHQVLMAFGDTFGIRGYPGDHWRPNILFRSADATLDDGITLADPEWFTGNDFGGSPLTWVPKDAPYQYHARQIIFPEGLPAGITLIPTAGISVPTQGTEYGVTQYISFMSVTRWGAPGNWTTNYSAIAYSEDNGEVWKVAPQTVRYNQSWTGNQNFQQSALVRPGDGYVYVYGTPNGRQGAAYVSRVLEKDILDLTKYEYYGKQSSMAQTLGWIKNKPSAATPVIGGQKGACGVASKGNTVSEMSVQYNQSLKKYVVLYGDQSNSIVMRTSDTPQGTWSEAKVLMGQQNGGIYAPMMHPWSPSTLGTGSDLYWNLSLWSEYNVMLMRTDLTKV